MLVLTHGPAEKKWFAEICTMNRKSWGKFEKNEEGYVILFIERKERKKETNVTYEINIYNLIKYASF